MLWQYGTRRAQILWILLEAFDAYFVAPKDSVNEHRRADVPTCWCNNTEKTVDYGNFSIDLNLHISFSDTDSTFIPLTTIWVWLLQGETALRCDITRKNVGFEKNPTHFNLLLTPLRHGKPHMPALYPTGVLIQKLIITKLKMISVAWTTKH